MASNGARTHAGIPTGSGSDRTASHHQGTRSGTVLVDRSSQTRGHRLSGLLAVALLLLSLQALYEVTQLRRATPRAAQASRSIQTIRTFYADLNDYLESGNAQALSRTLVPGALAFVPAEGILGEGSELLTYLLALRSTVPHLRFTVEAIDAGDDLAIATVRVSGVGALPDTDGVTSQEFFRVRDGRIIEHWTTASGSALQHPLTAPPVRIQVFQPGHLAIAELVFAPHHSDPQAIDGPALVIVQRGHLTLQGDDSSQIVDIVSGAASVPALNERAIAGPGQAILIPEHQIFVQNREADAVTARIATFVADPRQFLDHIPGERHPPPPALNDASILDPARTTISGAVTVRPLAFGDRSIPTGHWEMSIAVAVLGPGTSLPLAGDGEWAVARVLAGDEPATAPEQHDSGMPSMLANNGNEPALALVIRVRAAP